MLGSVHTPTWCSQGGDRVAPFEASELSRRGIPNAELRELPPGEHYAIDLTTCCREQCSNSSASKQMRAAERVLSTVLFTDIVGSTELLAAHGDEHWR